MNQLSVFLKSVTISNVWKAYRYYQRRALKYGFERITLVDYKKLYQKYQ